ncbi:MAG: DNA mismatch repair endonuclease MutL [Prevotella sp.]|nr:DNA mismatch repair endonuclease MutL [Prevotella sp.]
MSDIIQLLPDSVANQIAAGEVIQRPASVVKELVENAVDAGARHISVVVVDAGRTSIQVIDDGEGMTDTDARLAFERHATSKIRKADDLFTLTTMGFRGEALPSIAAVAQVTLRTRHKGDDIGTLVSISGSKFRGQEPVACPEGANFLVENLFFNVPARRKFLKSNTTELNNILIAFERIALVNPDIAFKLHSNGAELLNLPRAGLRQRIIDVFGKRLNQDLLPVGVETSMCHIYGFTGKPEASRKKGAQQYFFVNGRFMRHPYFHRAVQNAYERVVPQGEQVPYFIYFDVTPGDIDVNIHPTKTEIKFENEQAIWQILTAAVKDAIGRFHDVPSIDFDTVGKPDIPVFDPSTTATVPKVQYNPQYNPFEGDKPRRKAAPEQWETLFPDMTKPEQPEPTLFTPEETDGSIIDEKAPVHYQYKGQYIMTAVKSGLMIIDQHRAHMRILYEEYLSKTDAHAWAAQRLLFPEMVTLGASEAVVLRALLPTLETMGFDVADLGGGSFAVNAIPSEMDGVGGEHLLREFVQHAVDETEGGAAAQRERLALTMARTAAIPYGQVLTNEEMDMVVNRLFTCRDVNHTPDGKAIQCILKQQEIEQMLA